MNLKRALLSQLLLLKLWRVCYSSDGVPSKELHSSYSNYLSLSSNPDQISRMVPLLEASKSLGDHTYCGKN